MNGAGVVWVEMPLKGSFTPATGTKPSNQPSTVLDSKFQLPQLGLPSRPGQLRVVPWHAFAHWFPPQAAVALACVQSRQLAPQWVLSPSLKQGEDVPLHTWKVALHCTLHWFTAKQVDTAFAGGVPQQTLPHWR